MRLKTYSEFILEKETQSQLQQLALVVSKDMPDNKYIYDNAYNTGKIFKVIDKEDSKISSIDMPVINYSNVNLKRLLKGGLDESMIYNKLDAKKKVASKKEWHMLHEGSIYLPKTVYNPEDVKNLAFPIIAKPDNRYAGQGIVVFTSPAQLKSMEAVNEKFALFSEKIDIDEEFRVFCWRGTPITTMYRIPANDATKNLSKDPEDKLEFNYELSTQSPPKETLEIIKEFSAKHKDLDFYSIDFAKSGKKHYVIEMSTEPGPCFGVLGHVYKRMYQDHYGKEMSPHDYELIDQMIREDIDATIASDPKRFKVRKDGIS